MPYTENRRRNFNTNKQSLGDILNDFFNTFIDGEEYYHRVGIVKSVNQSEATAEVQIINGDTLPDVHLQQIANDDGLLMLPKTDSVVLVGWSDNTTAFIAMYSELDNVIFHDGTFGGLIKINDLTTKINELVSTVNAFRAEYKAHTHLDPVSGSTGTPQPVPVQADAATFTASDYENTRVQH